MNYLLLHLLFKIFRLIYYILPESDCIHLISTILMEMNEIFVAINVKFKIERNLCVREAAITLLKYSEKFGQNPEQKIIDLTNFRLPYALFIQSYKS